MRYSPLKNDLPEDISLGGLDGQNGEGFEGLANIAGRQLTDGTAAPDGLDRVRPVAPCVADRRADHNAFDLPPGVVPMSELVPLALQSLGLPSLPALLSGDALPLSAVRLIHDFPARADGENGQQRAKGSSETAARAEQEIVSKSRIEAAPPLHIKVDSVARKVSKFAKMLDSMPLSLRNEDARVALREEVVEYRDRLSFLLETECSVTSDTEGQTASLITSSNNPDTLLNRVNPPVCNLKQTYGRNGCWKALQGPCRTATLPDQQMTDGCTNGETSAYGVPSITPSLSRFRSMRSRAYSSNTYDPS